jgi:hypothetical protein
MRREPGNVMRFEIDPPGRGGTTPAMTLNSVVLPAPLGPMIARRCPRGTVSLTPSTARRASNATTTSVSVRIGSDTIVPGRALPATRSRLAVATMQQLSTGRRCLRPVRHCQLKPS